MAIVKLQPDAQPPIVTTSPEAIQEPNKSIFTTLIPESKITSLLKYVEGFPWNVNYYGQIVNTNNTLENFDPSVPNLTQPYYEVKDLVIQVSSPLTSNYDNTTGITSVTGAGLMPYKIIPNAGDIFIAKIDSSEDAIFTIISVTRKTYRKDTIYEVAYSLYSYISQNPSFYDSLKLRIQDTYYFNKDSNFFNRDNLIKPSVKEAIDRLNLFLYNSQEYYFNTFIQNKTGSIMIPGTDAVLFDPLLIKFILSIVDYDNLNLRKLSIHNYANNSYIEQPSILDALLSRNKAILSNVNKRYKFVSSVYLNNKTRFGTPYFANIDFILFPLDPNLNINVADKELISENMDLSTEVKTTKNYFVSPLTFNSLLNWNSNSLSGIKPLLPELFIDDYYIVSKEFYDYMDDNNTTSQISYLEFIIYKFLNNEAIAKEDLAICIENYNKWSLLHQTYFLPVMWLIIKSYM